MIFPTSPTSQAIIQALGSGPMKGPNILAQVNKEYPSITKQAVYQALRILMKDEIIIKSNTFFSINRLWAYTLRTLSDTVLGPTPISSSMITSMREGDRLSYYFKDIYQSDIVWGNIADTLLDNTAATIPIIMYFPHEWFLIAREHSEAPLLQRYGDEKKTLLIALGGQTQLDKVIQKDWNKKCIHVNTGTSYNFKNNYYVNIYDDYIIEVTIPFFISEAIDKFYKNNQVLTPAAREEITHIVQQPHRTKFVLTRNHKRAEVLRKKIAKDFVY
jgi:hypothetical protein